ncbi:hypothetical protein [Owenweeksia hongkongensis]|uniref:hypothetical protein n=1 Tax=Owenweeksia hongkongensis TaxID=253245 RepID=UPI003A90F332
MELKDFLDIIQATSVTMASIAAVHGIFSWRREAKWRKKYELAEEVLSCFYDISDRFDVIRNPAGYVGEGQTRKKNENESADESAILDMAYVVVERYEREKAPFIRLKSLKYRFMVIYGKKAEEPFQDILRLTNKLFFASHKLGKRYWKDQGRRNLTENQFEEHLKEMQKQEAIFYAGYDETDEFKESVNHTICKIEKICKKVIEQR